MHGWLKRADAPPSATGATAASPLPTPSIAPTPAGGLKGPAGLSPRTNYTRVNTGTPPQPDAGSESQKSMPPRGAEMLPKRASADGEDARMGTMHTRPLLQDMVKAAMVEGARRASVNDEAHRQSVKLASEDNDKCDKCGKDKEKCACMGKTGSVAFQGAVVEKLASALDFMASELLKNAEGSLGGPYNLTEHLVTSPPGVSQATASQSLPDHKGQATPKAVIPMHPPMQKDLPAEHGATQMKDNMNEGLTSQHMPPNIVSGGKHASVFEIIQAKLAAQKTAGDEHEKKETKGLEEVKKGLETAAAAHKSEPENKDKDKDKEGAAFASVAEHMAQHVKQAEDAINPAKISAGAAVPPQTSEAGQSGGKPVGGTPKGPSGLVASNDSARNYQRSSAYAPRKEEMGKYLKEPMMSMEHDSVLRDAFKHTGQAGTKFAEAMTSPETQAVAALATVKEATAPPPVATPSAVSTLTKAAAAKVMLSRLAAEITQAQAAAGGQ